MPYLYYHYLVCLKWMIFFFLWAKCILRQAAELEPFCWNFTLMGRCQCREPSQSEALEWTPRDESWCVNGRQEGEDGLSHERRLCMTRISWASEPISDVLLPCLRCSHPTLFKVTPCHLSSGGAGFWPHPIFHTLFSKVLRKPGTCHHRTQVSLHLYIH